MTLTFAPYVAPSGSCSGRAGRGTLTFAAYMEFLYKEQFSMGAYVCRQIAGKALLSGHAKGRAYDEGLALVNGAANPLGLTIINRVCQHGKELGIDHAIFNLGGSSYRGRPWIWNARNPAGEPYLGVHPHKDHIHWGLTTLASQNLTWATLDHYLGAEMTDAEWVRMEKLVEATVVKVLGGGPITMPKVNEAEATRRGNQGIVNSVWHATIGGQKTVTVIDKIPQKTWAHGDKPEDPADASAWQRLIRTEANTNKLLAEE